jgi:4-hydroxybenzoate polyprenyltransferase
VAVHGLNPLTQPLEFVVILLRAMRPRQWTKNVLLFAGLFFSRKMLDPDAVKRALAGFIIFCALSGSIYLINDVIDKPRDMLHPRKRRRPIASGEFPVRLAVTSACLLIGLALIGGFLISTYFGMCALAYLMMMICYTMILKEVFLIDTLIIAMGFLIRAVSGVIILRTNRLEDAVPLTPWFVICVLFLSLFLAVCKRRGERQALVEEALQFRPVLALYSVPLLDKLISLTSSGCVLSYTLYAISLEALDPSKMWKMLTTLIFVLFGIFRYLHLVYNQEAGEAPEAVLTADLPLLGCVLLWGLALIWVYFPV